MEVQMEKALEADLERVLSSSASSDTVELSVSVLNGDVFVFHLPRDAPVSKLQARVAQAMGAKSASRVQLFHANNEQRTANSEREQLKQGATLGENEVRDGCALAAVVRAITLQEVCQKWGVEEINQQNWLGFTPADEAARDGRTDLLEELIEVGATMGDSSGTPAFFAAERGQAGCLELLRDAGMDLGVANGLPTTHGTGNTPAHMAAANGHAECLLVLREAGVNLDVANNDGNTPAHLAADNGHPECEGVLRDGGAGLPWWEEF